MALFQSLSLQNCFLFSKILDQPPDMHSRHSKHSHSGRSSSSRSSRPGHVSHGFIFVVLPFCIYFGFGLQLFRYPSRGTCWPYPIPELRHFYIKTIVLPVSYLYFIAKHLATYRIPEHPQGQYPHRTLPYRTSGRLRITARPARIPNSDDRSLDVLCKFQQHAQRAARPDSQLSLQQLDSR